MTGLASFDTPIVAVVIGATGAIGRALVAALASDPGVARVHACARGKVAVASPKVRAHRLDLHDAGSITATARAIAAEGPPALVIVATGVLHREPGIRPEKTYTALNADALAALFAVNTTGPALIAKAFLPLLPRRTKSVFAALSARVGSIGDNRLGGWIGYRASKAALNMVVKTIAIEHSRRNPASVVAALHPGTVDSALSAPFKAHVPGERLFPPARAADYLLAVIDGLMPGDSGGFFAWDGRRIEY